MNITDGKSLIEQLVEDFSKNEHIYLSKNFNETEARTRFIDPLFKALGWEFEQNHLSFDYWDVHREYSQRDNSVTKKPDYAFRINRRLKFFVEAKAPWVTLTDKAPVFQAKRYAYSTGGKAPIVILTDFEEFRVFNALERPYFDNPLQGLLKEFDIKYQQYPEKWELIYEYFSKDAVANGSIERLSGKYSAKNRKKLDDDFLEEITVWREILAKNIALRNKELNADEINEAVQRILDRVIFIRNLEDRDIEPENTLLKTAENKAETYPMLIPLFQRLTGEYNGLLFRQHFSENLNIDDRVIKKIILELCYPRSPFRFDLIEPEILGHIYERFLGSEIRLTKSHQAKVEEKPEIRKAGGVYYTPEYIVNYIVKQTVGKIIEGMSPEEIESVKIADPACGSGSFLLGAFDYLVRYHERYYAENKKKKRYRKDFSETPDGTVHVTLSRKGEILKNNIFGTDIDREATEVAIMSLYLKLLDKGFEKGQLQFLRGHILPDLAGNIKCGNSLIRSDFFKDSDNPDFEEIKRVNPFDWEKEFPDIFKNGGFDAVIGNPPYVFGRDWKSLNIPESIKKYLGSRYKSSPYQLDMFSIFMEKASEICRLSGRIGQIVPNVWLTNIYSSSTRSYILKQAKDLHLLIPPSNVFDKITVDTIVYTYQKSEKPDNLFYIMSMENQKAELLLTNKIDDYSDGSSPISTSLDNKAANLIFRLKKDYAKLDTVAEITRGVHSYRIGGYGKTAFGIGHQTLRDVEERPYHSKIRGEEYRPFIYGKDLKRFVSTKEKEFVKYGNWLAEPRKPIFFEGRRVYSRKILGDRLVVTLETNDSVADQQVYITKPNPDTLIDAAYLAGILGSNLTAFYIRKYYDEANDAFPQIKVGQLKSLPVRIINFNNSAEKSLHDQMVNLVERILDLNNRLASAKSSQDKSILQREIDRSDKQIDQTVYKLYSLTSEEIKIAEESFLK